jgi:hypothetical protein
VKPSCSRAPRSLSTSVAIAHTGVTDGRFEWRQESRVVALSLTLTASAPTVHDRSGWPRRHFPSCVFDVQRRASRTSTGYRWRILSPCRRGPPTRP